MAKTKQTEKKAEKATTTSVATVGTHGRVFQGYVTKKFPHRIVLEFERILYVKKYERYSRGKTRLHARLPEGMNVEVGDYVKVRGCRPLSKIIHFVVIEVVRKAEHSNNSKVVEMKK